MVISPSSETDSAAFASALSFSPSDETSSDIDRVRFSRAPLELPGARDEDGFTSKLRARSSSCICICSRRAMTTNRVVLRSTSAADWRRESRVACFSRAEHGKRIFCRNLRRARVGARRLARTEERRERVNVGMKTEGRPSGTS